MNLKRGDALRSMFMARCELGTASEAWAYVAEAFANEIRNEAIPWAHKALDEVGVPKGPDIAGRIRMLHDRSIDVIAPAHKALDEAGAPKSLDMAKRIRALAATRYATHDEAPHAHGNMTWSGASGDGEAPRLTENALNACKAFDAPTDPSDAVVYLATLLREGDAVRDELRAIIVEAIKGGA